MPSHRKKPPVLFGVTTLHGHGTHFGIPVPTITGPGQAQAFVGARGGVRTGAEGWSVSQVHLSEAIGKLGAAKRVEACRLARDAGWLWSP